MGHKRLALGADSCLTQVVAGRLRVDTFCHFLCVCLATLTHVGTSVRIIGADCGSIPSPLPHPPPHPPPNNPLVCSVCCSMGEVEAQDKNQISFLSYNLMTDGPVKVREVLGGFCLILINFNGLREEALDIQITFVFPMDTDCF
ncbi:hypothetical protein NQZ68_010771 [Dissostichus eleginoides]|nr:hypothetical protein NQZ68_010771 [Dissostichus eleginoides]